jgi:hypothetical protein
MVRDNDVEYYQSRGGAKYGDGRRLIGRRRRSCGLSRILRAYHDGEKERNDPNDPKTNTNNAAFSHVSLRRHWRQAGGSPRDERSFRR